MASKYVETITLDGRDIAVDAFSVGWFTQGPDDPVAGPTTIIADERGEWSAGESATTFAAKMVGTGVFATLTDKSSGLPIVVRANVGAIDPIVRIFSTYDDTVDGTGLEMANATRYVAERYSTVLTALQFAP